MLDYGAARYDEISRRRFVPSDASVMIKSAMGGALVLLVATACVALVVAPHFFRPAEDAVILYQYAENFAKTGVISYIENGPRAEGATDFLWLMMLSAARYLGIGIFSITGWINAASAVGIGLLLVSIANVRRSLVNVAIATLVSLASIQVWAAIAGFSVFAFGFLVTLCAYAHVKRKDGLLAVASLLLCLFRPDGIIFAAPLAAMRLIDSSNRLSVFVRFLLLCVLPGAVYFVWRWHYFGEFLPLPFMVKSDAERGLGPFTAGGIHELRLQLEWCLPLLVIFLASGGPRRLNIELLLALIVIPSLFYASMRLDQNWADRFYFYFVIGTAILAAVNWRHIRIPRRALAVLIVGLYVLFMGQFWKSLAVERFRDRVNNFSSIAQEIHADGLRGTMAVSEAGALNFYSRWEAYDLWGLNTVQFAGHLMQPSELVSLNADLVEVYFPRNGGLCKPGPTWKTPYQNRSWDHLAANAVAALADEPYQLWMVPYLGPVGKTADGARRYLNPQEEKYNCIYIKDSYPERDRLVGILQRHGALTPEEYAKRLGPAHDIFE